MSGCTTSSTKQTATAPEQETYLPAEPTQNTKIVTYHVQAEKFSPALQKEFEQALVSLSGKCWIWALPSHKNNLTENEPEYCLKFVRFETNNSLKRFKSEPTDKKMLLTALNVDGHIQVQNFVWNGAKLQRVRNSDSFLNGRSFQDFMVLWALK